MLTLRSARLRSIAWFAYGLALLAASTIASAQQGVVAPGSDEIPPFVCDRVELVRATFEPAPLAARACGLPFVVPEDVPPGFDPNLRQSVPD